MASTRGPLPKRGKERAGHNAKREAADEVVVLSRVPVPPPKPEWDAQTVAWYEALAISVMAAFYEPADWVHALAVGDLVDDFNTDRHAMSAEKMKQMFAELDKLGVTESARRRLRVEGHRPGSEEDEDAPKASEAVLDRFAKAADGGA